MTQSQMFIKACVAQFRETFIECGCKIDLDSVRFVPYLESREDKERRFISDVKHEMYEIFVRPDILQGHVGYSRSVHLDHRRRLMTLLVYLCDADENGMEGGDLVLVSKEKSLGLSGERAIRPAHNRMVAFACSNASHHRVTNIIRQNAPRNFLQITLSSSVDIWPDT